MVEAPRTYRRIYLVVSRIPRGRVATYGQVASLAGLARQPRLVGYALSALPARAGVPWHRVINAKGLISARSNGLGYEALQRLLLEREGIRFDTHGVISLTSFQWHPRPARREHEVAAGAGASSRRVTSRRKP